MRSATITLHQSHLTHNAHILKNRTHAKLLAMVKADAYGHGVSAVVPALLDADGFGVACMSEALAVKAVLTDDRPIVLIEGVFGFDEWQQAITNNFMAVIHHDSQLDYALTQRPTTDSHTHTIWLKYNTGMNRLGFDKEHAMAACDRLIDAGYHIVLISHFACADTPDEPANQQQIQAFDELYHHLKDQYGDKIQGSLCNSAGLIGFDKHHYDWVRAGIALYGSSPFAHLSRDELHLKPAMTLSAKIMATHHLSQGDKVGYGGLWTAPHDSRIGIVSLGYGDGYPRVVNHAKVSINGVLTDIIGRVAMDMIAVDISHLDAKIGDDVIFWGDNPSIDTIASCANTIGYELLCRLTNRPTRITK